MKTTWLESARPSDEPNDCYPVATLRTDSPNPTFAVGKMRTRKCHLLGVGAPLAPIVKMLAAEMSADDAHEAVVVSGQAK